MQDLVKAALDVREKAYAPYSRFLVGVAIRGASGRVYVGANVENASFPEGWCAETSAIGAMIAAGERQIVEVCVAGDSPAPLTPCGGCRQRLAEFGAAETPVHSAGPDGLRRSFTLGELLPAAFALESSHD